ncbi:LysR family transcriptional regulator [Mesorhizobium sp. SB112]|uniref:LysR family transcriptional regulator n=1 Tax=Mesorhizobium sp. SB112 TaxID=3151853 RepID=UPI003266198B
MNTPLDSELLRTFLAVAETGNFTKAATSVYRTQSAVSMQIKRLEEGIGAALFMRGSRGVELTRKGEQLLDNARRIVSLLDETAASMSSPPLTGRVRIGIPEEWGYAMLSRALGTFAKAHPDVEISARYGCSTQHMNELRADDLDIAVVFEWQDFSDGEILMTDPTVWVTSDAHVLHEQRPLPIALYENSGWCMDFALKSLDTRELPYRVAYRSDTSGGLKIAVASGLAIAPISRSNIPEGCRELTADEGFGNIDASNVVMHRNARSQGDVSDGMARAIRDAFSAVS